MVGGMQQVKRRGPDIRQLLAQLDNRHHDGPLPLAQWAFVVAVHQFLKAICLNRCASEVQKHRPARLSSVPSAPSAAAVGRMAGGPFGELGNAADLSFFLDGYPSIP